MRKCIVIGSGIAGIASAIRIRKLGFEVVVLEANSYPGGKLSAFNQGPYRFDAGPSLFTMPHLVDELFTLCGEDSNLHFTYSRLEESCRYFYPDGSRLVCSSDRCKLAEQLKEKFGEDARSVIQYFKKSAGLYHLTEPVFLKNSLHQLNTYFSKSGLKGIFNLWKLNFFSSMHESNVRRFKDPRTIQFFDRFATYNGSNPYRAPATLNVIPHLEFGFGTFFPKQGMYSICQSLYELAKRQGIEFCFNTRVEEILTKKKSVIGVRVGQETVPADLVVCNMDIYPAYKYLLPHVKTPYRVKNIKSSSSALIFYWGMNREFNALGLHNIFFSKNYQVEFNSIFNRKTVPADNTIYVHVSSKAKKDDAPAGCENWFVMINVPHNTGQNWDDIVKEARKNIIKKISSELEIDIEAYIENESILDPRQIELKTSSYRGALYGSDSNHIFSAFFRHSNVSSKIKNLYFCGGSVHPGGGIPLCLMGAKIVAQLIDKVK